MIPWVFGGASLAVAAALVAAFWFRSKASDARLLAVRKEAERDKEVREHNETLEAMKTNAARYVDDARRKQEALDYAEQRLREVRLVRLHGLTGSELLAAGNRLFGTQAGNPRSSGGSPDPVPPRE